MRSSRRSSTVLTVLGIILLVVSATILGDQYFGQGRAGRTLSSASLPPGLGPSPSASAPTVSGARAPNRSPNAVAVKPVPKPVKPVAKSVKPATKPVQSVQPVKLGVPVQVIVPDHRLTASVSANRLNADGSLYVPPDPRVVSWASQQVAPGSPHGTIILVAHINKGGVAGAFSDLADYRPGQVITVVLADGRRMKYAVVAEPIEVDKDRLGPRRQEMFDQTHSYGLAGRPKSGRLLLLSCGGLFDKRTGHYESNIFVYAFPI